MTSLDYLSVRLSEVDLCTVVPVVEVCKSGILEEVSEMVEKSGSDIGTCACYLSDLVRESLARTVNPASTDHGIGVTPGSFVYD